VLLVYYWNSALTKLGDGLPGIFRPSLDAYAQIFPRQMEAVNYNVQDLTLFHWAVVEAGMLAEFILPVLLLLGLMSRLAALAMIGFVVLQSLTDIYGHNLDSGTIGRWFDGEPGALLADQRALWIFALAVIVMLGAGPLSLDRLLRRSAQP
jgi:putative oxidoreductase